MDDVLGTSPLEFKDDYFASAFSSDDNAEELEEDSEGGERRRIEEEHNGRSESIYQRPNLCKTPSILSLSPARDGSESNKDTGIMFNELRTVPTSSLSLENASLNHFRRLSSRNDDNQLLSVYQPDDTMSTILSPMLESVNDYTLEPVVPETIVEEEVKTGFPYELCNNKFEKSDDDNDRNLFFNNRQHFFILSSAGKPIYSMHGSNELFLVYSGIIQTIVSFFKYSNSGEESIKMIESNDSRTGKPIKFVFLDKSPIILMTIIKNDESTQIELEQQLDFIYSFLISTLSKPYIEKIFTKYANFDLRNLLGKTDIQTLDSICEDLSNNLNISQILSGLQCLRMHSSVRSRLYNKLFSFKSQNFLYGLVIGPNEKLISIIKPRRHTLHTSDLMILFEMIYNTNTFKAKNDSGDLKFITNETFWVPICLPKFNSNGHLYTLIQFHQLNDERFFKLHDIEHNQSNELYDEDFTKIGIILLSPFKDSFNELRKVSQSLSKEILFDKKIFKDIWNSIVGNGRIIVDRVIGEPNSNLLSQPLPNSSSERRMTISSIMNNFSLNSKPSIAITTEYVIPDNIIHFTVKNKRLVQYIFPESKMFNIYDLTIKKNLLHIYKYLRRKLHFVTSDFNINVPNYDENIDDLNNNFRNNIVYESLNDIYIDERIVGFACKLGNYEIFIVGKGELLNENKLIEYSLKILRWCKRQEVRIFIK